MSRKCTIEITLKGDHQDDVLRNQIHVQDML